MENIRLDNPTQRHIYQLLERFKDLGDIEEDTKKTVERMLESMDEIDKTFCIECGGKGHSKNSCKYRQRLYLLSGKLNGADCIFNAAVKELESRYSSGSSINYKSKLKRSHAGAFRGLFSGNLRRKRAARIELSASPAKVEPFGLE